MKNWRSRQCCGLADANPPTPFEVHVVGFDVQHSDAFPDGTYAVLTFDSPLLSPLGTTMPTIAIVDTSGGPEGLNTDATTSVGDGTANTTTIDQVDSFTVGGSAEIDTLTGYDFGPGGVLVLPVTLTITSSI